MIIFGAGVVGEALFYACRKNNIRIDCFCDNNTSKKELLGLKVVRPSEAKKGQEFIIASTYIKDIVAQLKLLGHENWHTCNEFLTDFNVFDYTYSVPTDFAVYVINTCMLCQRKYVDKDGLFLHTVDIMITEKCTLRCRDCSNLMQYYKHPANCDTVELFDSIDKLCSIVDEVNDFRVIGGEVFLNKDWYLIVNRLVDKNKARKILIYSNGTIIPRNIDKMKTTNVLFLITDYGKDLSRKKDDMIKLLKKLNISYHSFEAKGWTNCAEIAKHERSEKENLDLFSRCCANDLLTLSNGRLYKCPFAANLSRLNVIDVDYVELNDKERIKNFIGKRISLAACDYCNGRSWDAPHITPAIQAKSPVELHE